MKNGTGIVSGFGRNLPIKGGLGKFAVTWLKAFLAACRIRMSPAVTASSISRARSEADFSPNNSFRAVGRSTPSSGTASKSTNAPTENVLEYYQFLQACDTLSVHTVYLTRRKSKVGRIGRETGRLQTGRHSVYPPPDFRATIPMAELSSTASLVACSPVLPPAPSLPLLRE